MEKINLIVKFLQDNWLTILLIIGGFITILIAVADYKVRMAKLTPDLKDDEEAKYFKARVQVFVQLLKDIFRIGKKKKENGSALLYVMIGIALIVALAGGYAGYKKYQLPNLPPQADKVKTDVVQNVQAEKEVKKSHVKKRQKVSVKKVAVDGSSEEIVYDLSSDELNLELSEQLDLALKSKVTETNQQLGIYFGAGVRSKDFFKPLASVILVYDHYAGSAQSDFRVDHAAFIHYGFQF